MPDSLAFRREFDISQPMSDARQVQSKVFGNYFRREMKKTTWLIVPLIVASNMALLAGAAMAQSGSGANQAAGATAQGATAPASAPGPELRKRAGRGHAAWWGSDVTPGWALMTWAERNEHRKRMRSMKTHEECTTYIEQHHTQMAARATEKGRAPLTQPRRDACARLQF